MRELVIVALLLCSTYAAPASAAGGKAKPAPKASPVDTMIRSVFGSADRNGNGVLSQPEFHRAQANLTDAIMQLAREGKLTAGKKNSKQSPPNGAAVFGMPLVDVNKSNQISQTDFAAYAAGVVKEAIAAKAASDARAKASAQNRQKNSRGRSNVRRQPQRNQATVVAAPPRKAPAGKGKANGGGKIQPAKSAPKK